MKELGIQQKLKFYSETSVPQLEANLFPLAQIEQKNGSSAFIDWGRTQLNLDVISKIEPIRDPLVL
jgi:hypothetical protein